MIPRAPLAALALAVMACLTASCGSCKGASDDGPMSDRHARAGGSPRSAAAQEAHRIDLIGALPTCDIEHRGLLFDAGTEAMIGRYGWLTAMPERVANVEHDGSTWMRITDRKLTLSFVQQEASPIFVAARSMGFASRLASVALDDQPLGTLSFQRGQIRVATTNTTTLPVDPGLHTITMRFSGRSRDGTDPYVDLAWIRIGVPDDSTATYGPPTLRDIVLPAAALSGVPHRSLAQRAPGAVRCSVKLPETARLRTAIGMLGAGEGDAEIRVLRDGKQPEVLHTVHLTGGDKATWTDVDLPLAPVGRAMFTLELRALSAPPGGRILFGDPVIAMPAPSSAPVAPARAVIIVALDGVERSNLPPWSGAPAPHLPALSELALTATVFDRHRAPTTVIGGVMGSLVTGLSPKAHGLADTSARLPASQTTIGTVARDASIRTAMFTGVPQSFRAFGFGGSWERFVEHAPNTGDLATAPLDSAAAWVTEITREVPDARLLVVVHARGGHPPWDISPKQLEEVPPPDYAGPLDPRRAAQVLAVARRKRAGEALTTTDRERMRVLAALALAGQDRALGALVAALKTAGLWDATLFVVTGDVSSGASDAALFADALELKESALEIPMYVRFPGGVYGGTRVIDPTEIVDIPHTALAALGLSFAPRSSGRDLALVASGGDGGGWEGPQIATLDDRYSTRWGTLILSGRFGSAPQLCDLSVDPTCAFNRRDAMPMATQALFRRTAAADLATRATPGSREPATIDAEMSAVLNVWGATE